MCRRRRWPEDRLFAPETESGSGSSLTSIRELAGKREREKKSDKETEPEGLEIRMGNVDDKERCTRNTQGYVGAVLWV